jgi:hypothetical protein
MRAACRRKVPCGAATGQSRCTRTPSSVATAVLTLAIFACAVAADATSAHAKNAMTDAASSRRKIEHDIRSAYRQDAKCR